MYMYNNIMSFAGLMTQFVLLRREFRAGKASPDSHDLDVFPLSTREGVIELNDKLADRAIFKQFVSKLTNMFFFCVMVFAVLYTTCIIFLCNKIACNYVGF